MNGCGLSTRTDVIVTVEQYGVTNYGEPYGLCNEKLHTLNYRTLYVLLELRSKPSDENMLLSVGQLTCEGIRHITRVVYMSMIRVLVADDNIQYRWALIEALSGTGTLQVMDEASNGNEAVEKALALKPHVVLMDLHMPECDGVEATRRLQKEMPDVKVLVNTVSEKEKDLVDALKAGARGYMLKSEKPEMIAEAILYVAQGGIIVSPSMATTLLREFRILEQAGEGFTLAPVGAVSENSDAGPETGTVQQPAAEVESEVAEPAPKSTLSTIPDTPVPSADLVIPPPLEPSTVLRLHKWLKDVAEAEIDWVNASLNGDTVIRITLRQPVPLAKMLDGLSYVAEVAPEIRTSDETTPSDSDSPLHRYRLVLTKG